MRNYDATTDRVTMGFDKWSFDRVRQGMDVRFICDHFKWSNWEHITIEITHELTPKVIVPTTFTITTSEPQTMSVVIKSEDVLLLGMYHIKIRFSQPLPGYHNYYFEWVAFEMVGSTTLTMYNEKSFCKCDQYFNIKNNYKHNYKYLMKHFTITELCRSDKGSQLRIANNPTPEACDNLIALTENILDPARDALGRAVHVNSGYRCTKLNGAVGGASRSQHLTGEAVDIELGSKSRAENEELYNWIYDNCEYDQLINEHNFGWVHVSYREGYNRNQQLKIG